MKTIIAIPARYGSTRLPGKPLLELGGKPMIYWTYQRAKAAQATDIVVATDDVRIFEVCESYGMDVVMTAADHESGTDRLAELAKVKNWSDDDIVVNLQGDEPTMPSTLLNQVATNLVVAAEASISTLCTPINDAPEAMNPNVVKVVFDQNGYALYFSRAPIPWDRDRFPLRDEELNDICMFRHLGIYAYRAGFLKQYPGLKHSRWEQLEKLEQLRAMDAGFRIHVDVAKEAPGPGVDTEEDWRRAQSHFSRE